jgi:molybdopterin-dependent oxidoreductase alpha subunit
MENANENKKQAGGWGSLTSSLFHLVKQKAVAPGVAALLRMNKPTGVDCPSCAWADPKDPSIAEFCENGVKAIAAETTKKRITNDFFHKHSVKELLKKDGFYLEQQGRLTHPMLYNNKTDHYDPIDWDDAFGLIGNHIKNSHPDALVFYTSGRTSNEAAFLYQLFGRALGTNNFPDCSNMCHESSGVALTESIGIGKGTVSLEDFEEADAIFIMGQNPGTNHPRMLTELEKASKRGCQIVSINPLKEPGLQNFIHPQSITDMLLNKSTSISSLYLQPVIGGDFAFLKGMIKFILDQDQASPGTIDRDFIHQHTLGFDELKKDIEATSWDSIIQNSGLQKEDINRAAEIYFRSSKTIICWAMGLTQSKHAVITIQYIVNLILLKGNIGRAGAGLCPVRGHSNVQGDRTMGIVEKPKKEFLDALGKAFRFTPPDKGGYNTVEAIKAMASGKIDVFVAMGGNFAEATPDTSYTEKALKNCKLTVHISTKLNRSHLITGNSALILPCLGRTEKDLQYGVPQKVTVEDSMSMVHASEGKNQPASQHLLSEPAIVAKMAMASMENSSIDWMHLISNYDIIRNKISEVLPDFESFNEKIKSPGGFHLRNSASEREWNTPSGKARFMVEPLTELEVPEGYLRLMTIRSHDQFNTTIYGLNDRYRGIEGERKVVFINPEDMNERYINNYDLVDIISFGKDGIARTAKKFKVIPYDIPKGCVAAYFPETNILVPIDSIADKSHTPTSKFIPVTLIRKVSI